MNTQALSFILGNWNLPTGSYYNRVAPTTAQTSEPLAFRALSLS